MSLLFHFPSAPGLSRRKGSDNIQSKTCLTQPMKKKSRTIYFKRPFRDLITFSALYINDLLIKKNKLM